MTGLKVLVVEDELPALEELTYLLDRSHAVASVKTAASGTEALRVLQTEQVDAAFLDIRMPGLDGMELARVLGRFAAPPQVVFVTAYEEYAVDAFDLKACDYLLKPIHEERLARAVGRIVEARGRSRGNSGDDPPGEAPDDEVIPVELGGVTQFIARSEVRFAEAHGDYVKLHTGSRSYLVRASMATLADRWSRAGFVRTHRSYLVALRHVDQLRWNGGRMTVRVGDATLQVSRRHAREVRDRLLRARAADRGDVIEAARPRLNAPEKTAPR